MDLCRATLGRFQCASNTGLYLTGASTGAHLTLEPATSNGSQEWRLAPRSASVA
jgi:hypothetical protein